MALERQSHLIESYTLNMRRTHTTTERVRPYTAPWLEFWTDIGRRDECVERMETHADAPNPAERVQ